MHTLFQIPKNSMEDVAMHNNLPDLFRQPNTMTLMKDLLGTCCTRATGNIAPQKMLPPGPNFHMVPGPYFLGNLAPPLNRHMPTVVTIVLVYRSLESNIIYMAENLLHIIPILSHLCSTLL
jgi:hypothetical protein